MRTLDRAGDVLSCACGRRYPIVDGIPVVMAEGAPDLAGVAERELSLDAAALLLERAPDDDPYARIVDQLGVYLDTSWGDGARELVQRITERGSVRVSLAVELGCSVGRVLDALAGGADQVVGVDRDLAALRRARRLLSGESVTYLRRIVGRHFAQARVTGVARDNVTLVCGDALDPPLVNGFYDRVVALNMLDSVASPRQLLAVIDGLCAPGGEVILTSPYAWRSEIVPERERFGGADPAGALIAQLREGYEIEDEADLTWELRRDARCTLTYKTHYLRARKRGT